MGWRGGVGEGRERVGSHGQVKPSVRTVYESKDIWHVNIIDLGTYMLELPTTKIRISESLL